MNHSLDYNQPTGAEESADGTDDDALVTDLLDEFDVDEETRQGVRDAMKLTADEKDEVRALENDLRGLQRGFGDLEVEKLVLREEIRCHRTEITRLKAELAEQQILLDDMDRQRQWQDLVERESMAFNTVLLDTDELEEFTRDPSPPPPARAYTTEDMRRLERKAKKTVAEARKTRLARKRVRKAVKRTTAAINEAKFIADNAEIDTFLLRQHKEALIKIVENASDARSEAKESLNDLVVKIRTCFDDAHTLPSPTLLALLEKHKHLFDRLQLTKGSLVAGSQGSSANNSDAVSNETGFFRTVPSKMYQLLR